MEKSFTPNATSSNTYVLPTIQPKIYLYVYVCAFLHKSQNSLACTQNPLFVTSHGGLDMIFRDPTCPYGAVVVAVVVCVDVYYWLHYCISTLPYYTEYMHKLHVFLNKMSLQTQPYFPASSSSCACVVLFGLLVVLLVCALHWPGR